MQSNEMTHIEKICKIMGATPPNVNVETGIHYGVISQHDVGSDALDDIYSYGIDLSYESAVSEVQDIIRGAMAGWHADMNDNVILLDLQTSRLKDYIDIDLIDADLVESIVQALIAKTPKKDIVTLVWEAVQEDCSENYSMGDTSTALYRYESDGLTIETSDTDLFIITSPYYTLAGQCSPCAPNAGYLTSEGTLKTYCLSADWFEDGKLPYDVYSVATGQLVTAKSEVSE